jgi:hypothetical protein
MPRKINIQKHDAAMRTDQAQAPGVAWHSPRKAPFQIAGLAWFAAEGLYRRMPAKPARPLPASVDSLANCTAGAQVRFRSDSKRVWVRVKLRAPHSMDHMPATGQCGFDCYVGPVGSMRYGGTARFKHALDTYESALFSATGGGVRQYTLNFPLYQGVNDLEIGLDEGARVLPPAAWERGGRAVVYGTSITQGGCATRPGMAFLNILSRRINREFINLGFSGSGRGEPEVAEAIAQIERVGLFVLDYEANCLSSERLRETMPEFIRILRAAHPRAPILVVSKIRYARELHDPAQLAGRLERRAFQKSLVARLRRAGDKRIFFQDGSGFLGRDFDECAVDGAHPTDLGFLRMADGLEPAIRKCLKS